MKPPSHRSRSFPAFIERTNRQRTWRFIPLLLLLIPGAARAVFPPGNTNLNSSLDTWSFNDATNWTSDLGYAPISFTNLSSSPLGDGSALVLDSTNAAWLQYHVKEASGTNNLAVNQGTVMFWFAPNWTDTNNGGTGPGLFGRLIDVGAYTTNASYGWWGWYLDPAGTNIYFAAQTNGSQAIFLSAPVSWTKTNYWHMLALTYSATNSALYFDGKLVTNGAPVTIWPGSSVLTNGFYIGSDNTGIAQAHGMFDDVETYNYPLDAGTIGTAFIFSSFYYYANPLNRANFSSAPWYPNTNAGFQAITGSGYLLYLGTDTNCVTSSSVWITNVVAAVTTNRSVNLSFTIAGGSNNVAYDVFATADLQYPITNAVWAWMGQGNHCTRYMLTNLPLYSAYIILGTPQDTDGDGLTDAFELLVSHTDPNNPDTYGVGLSDGFQWGYYGQGGLDPYSDPLNNGWTLLDEYLNGLDPTVHNQPPAPQGVTASYVNSTATVQWNFSSGGVTGYKVEKFDPIAYVTNDVSVSAVTDEYVDASQQVIDDDLYYGPPLYRVQAEYGAQPSAWSGWVPLYKPDPVQFWGSGHIIRGTQGQAYLAIPPLPPNATTARIVFANSLNDTSWTVPVSSFTNSCYLLPPQLLPQNIIAGNWYLEINDGSSNLLGTIDVSYVGFSPLPFYDGRPQLQQNLSFLLRAANTSSPFQFTLEGPHDLFYDCASNYASASFVDLDFDDPGFPSLDEFSPFRNNYLYRNFVFATSDLNTNGTLDSAGDGANGPYVPQYPVHNFPGPTNGTHIDPVLSATDLPWTFFRSYYTTSSSELNGIGVSYGAAGFTLSSSAYNLFGLQLQSVQTAYNTNGNLYTTVMNAGATLADNGNVLYPATAQPTLVTTNYYFGRPFIDPLPGDAVFSPTNTTPILLASLEQPFWLAGYAKQAISNGSATKFGYLGQYFAGAFKIGTNGVVTTNQTGVLSEYGEFFPTEPGPTALVTMTNWGVNERGTAVVNVVSLCVDANHDGTMDQTLWGPDTTSFLRPFRFWVNSDRDFGQPSLLGPPFDPGHDVETPPNEVYPHDYQHPTIQSERDLEDYARLWICGMPALPMNAGYQVTLNWNVSGGSPAINLAKAAETNGGTLYLTDTNIAAVQIGDSLSNQSYKFAYITPTNSYTFPSSYFTNGGNKYILFEGAGVGQGALVMTVSQATTQGTNVLAQTSIYFDLREVRDMFERVHITGVTNIPPGNGFLSSSFVQDNLMGTNSDESTNIIAFVHGWRMGQWDYENFSETMFKRLYWQGFNGRFVTVRWPTLSRDDFQPIPLGRDYFTYNRSEFRAWESAKGLSDYLTNLKQRFPNYSVNVCSHSMGGIVMAEALKRQLASGQQNVRNYALMQAAVPASCYDATFTNYAPMLAAEASQPTPNTYRSYPGAIGGAVSGHLVNFYNTNDYALATGSIFLIGAVNWEANQENYKPNTGQGYRVDSTGTNCFNGFNIISDPREIMAFCARPRSRAVGAQPNVSGAIYLSGQIDLTGSFNFRGGSDQHSAEFNWPIQQVSGFYRQLGISLGVFQPSMP